MVNRMFKGIFNEYMSFYESYIGMHCFYQNLLSLDTSAISHLQLFFFFLVFACYQLISRYSQGNKIVKNIKTQECNKSRRRFM